MTKWLFGVNPRAKPKAKPPESRFEGYSLTLTRRRRRHQAEARRRFHFPPWIEIQRLSKTHHRSHDHPHDNNNPTYECIHGCSKIKPRAKPPIYRLRNAKNYGLTLTRRRRLHQGEARRRQHYRSWKETPRLRKTKTRFHVNEGLVVRGSTRGLHPL